MDEEGESAPHYDLEYLGDGQISVVDSHFASDPSRQTVLDLDGGAGSAWEQLEDDFVFLGEPAGDQRPGRDALLPVTSIVTPAGYFTVQELRRELPYVSATEIGLGADGARLGYYSPGSSMNILNFSIRPLHGEVNNPDASSAEEQLDDPRVFIETAELSTDLDGLSWDAQPGEPVAGHRLIYAAGGDERAELVVEFDGHQQRMDLHSGELVAPEDDPAASYYSAQSELPGVLAVQSTSLMFRLGDPGTVTAYDEARGAELAVRSEFDLSNVQSSGWTGDQEWAEPGQGWLTFDLTAMPVANQRPGQGPTRDYEIGALSADIVIPLDEGDDIELSLEGTESSLKGARDGFEFDPGAVVIPGDLEELTLFVTMHADVLDSETGEVVDEVSFDAHDVVYDSIY